MVEAVKKDGTKFRIKLCVSEVSSSISLILSLSLSFLSLSLSPFFLLLFAPHLQLFFWSLQVPLGAMRVWIGLIEKILSNQCIVTVNRSGWIVTVDHLSESLYGYSAVDLISKDIRSLIPGQQKPFSLSFSFSFSSFLLNAF